MCSSVQKEGGRREESIAEKEGKIERVREREKERERERERERESEREERDIGRET